MIAHEHPVMDGDILKDVEFRFTGLDWMEYHELSPNPCIMICVLPFVDGGTKLLPEKYVYCGVLQTQLLPLFGLN